MWSWVLAHKRLSVAVALVVVALGVVLLFSWDKLRGDTVTRIVAVGSFLATAAKVGYDIWDKHQEKRKKEAEKKERVKTFAKYRAGPAFMWVGVEIYNDGSSRIHLKEVAIRFRHNGTEKNFLLAPCYQPPEPDLHKLTGFVQTTYEVEPKAKVTFDPYGNERWPDVGGEDYRIVIESYQGLLVEIPQSDWQKLN